MRYSASDKIEIIRLVEQSHVPARRALEKLGIPRSSFYRWYDRYQGGGPEALADRPSRPDRVWNRIPEAIRSQIVDLALEQPELSPRELAVRFTDEEKYFVSEASVSGSENARSYHQPGLHRHESGRGVQGQDRRPTSSGRPTSHSRSRDGLVYLSTVLDNFSRFIVAWKLCATMKAQDVTATLDGAGGLRARSHDRRSPAAAFG